MNSTKVFFTNGKFKTTYHVKIMIILLKFFCLGLTGERANTLYALALSVKVPKLSKWLMEATEDKIRSGWNFKRRCRDDERLRTPDGRHHAEILPNHTAWRSAGGQHWEK